MLQVPLADHLQTTGFYEITHSLDSKGLVISYPTNPIWDNGSQLEVGLG